ncbi:hypothetical protein NXY07_26275 [Phocaeicola dorei]|jgi:hypothetical protein|nr:hypothetical protein [Phocaeicola dorei]
MGKRIIIDGDHRTVDNIIQENRIREEMGLISIEIAESSLDKVDQLQSREKKEPLRDKKEV